MIQISSAEANVLMKENKLPSFINEPGWRILILTQSWCSQWHLMKKYIPQLEKENTFKAAYFEYDLAENFESFMHFKEAEYRNDYVPYLRFYFDGAFISESNYLGESAFISRIRT